MATPLLEVRDLRVTFATPRGNVCAVDGVSFALGPGEIMGLVGESGSGKSVALRAMLRLLRANARVGGSVLWGGQDLLALPEARLRAIRGGQIGMVFQEPMAALNPVLTIGAQIDESLAAHTALDRAGRHRRAMELLDLVGIASPALRLNAYPHEFSGGMRQRAMIAIAMAPGPGLLLADEPTTALDVTIQDQILTLMKSLVRDLGMAMILVTHDLGVVAETCDHVSVIYAGRIAESGPTGAVFDQPRHAYTHALLRSMPQGGPAREALRPIAGQPPRLDTPARGCPFAPRCAFVLASCTQVPPPLLPAGPERVSACFASETLASLERVA